MSEANGSLNREAFLQKAKTKREAYVNLPGGDKLKLQSIPATERLERFDLWMLDKNGKLDRSKWGVPRGIRAVQLTAVNPDGTRMFPDDADFELLMESECGWLESAVDAAIHVLLGEDQAKN